jgi:hypothetical protein
VTAASKKSRPLTELRRLARTELVRLIEPRDIPAETREMFPDYEPMPEVCPVRFIFGVDGKRTVTSGRQTLSLDLDEIERVSPEHRRIIQTLLELLLGQADVATRAVVLAYADVELDAKRDEGRRRATQAAEDAAREWQAAAADLRARRPNLSNRAAAQYLTRNEPSKRETVRNALSKKLGKP